MKQGIDWGDLTYIWVLESLTRADHLAAKREGDKEEREENLSWKSTRVSNLKHLITK